MSVMTATSEADCAANSCSIAARSSRSRSKTSLAVAMERVLTLVDESIRRCNGGVGHLIRMRVKHATKLKFVAQC